MKFHLEQLNAVNELILESISNGYTFVSCQSHHTSTTPENYNAHFALEIKFYCDNTTHSIFVDVLGNVISNLDDR